MTTPTPPWQDYRDIAETIGDAYVDGLRTTLGSNANLGKVGSFQPEEMLAARPMPVHVTVIRFGAPLRDVAVLLASHTTEVTTQLALAGAERVARAFEVDCDVSVEAAVDFADLDVAIEQCDALWLEASYNFDLPMGDARLVIGTGLLESINSFVKGVADPFADGATLVPAVFDGPAMETLDMQGGAPKPAVAAPAAASGIDDLDALLAEQELADADLVPTSAAAAVAAPVSAAVAAPAAASAPDTRHSAAHWASLLSGVEVELSAELGSTALSLGDITSLMSESVLTLDQLVDEPVTVHVNGTRYATARLVVVDGEYGIEILEVLEQPAFIATTLAA
ncbi:MAG: fliN [Thermoleophilia bacterium]|nr:fliN [Thermoleophilia bacterium]